MGCVYCGGQPGNHSESCKGKIPTIFEKLMTDNQKLKHRVERLEGKLKTKSPIIDDLAHLSDKLFIKVLTTDLPDRDKHYHLLWMCDQITSGQVTGPKAHRWIGYIQGVLVCRGNYTLEEIKDLNKEI